jgi:hypothetical protein
VLYDREHYHQKIKNSIYYPDYLSANFMRWPKISFPQKALLPAEEVLQPQKEK